MGPIEWVAGESGIVSVVVADNIVVAMHSESMVATVKYGAVLDQVIVAGVPGIPIVKANLQKSSSGNSS